MHSIGLDPSTQPPNCEGRVLTCTYPWTVEDHDLTVVSYLLVIQNQPRLPDVAATLRRMSDTWNGHLDRRSSFDSADPAALSLAANGRSAWCGANQAEGSPGHD